jgi:hypothetical protein
MWMARSIKVRKIPTLVQRGRVVDGGREGEREREREREREMASAHCVSVVDVERCDAETGEGG